jgi:hypothetical protein
MMPSHPGRHREEKNDACHARGTRSAIRGGYVAAAVKDKGKGSWMGMWRQQAVQRLIDEVTGNILGEAAGSKIT